MNDRPMKLDANLSSRSAEMRQFWSFAKQSPMNKLCSPPPLSPAAARSRPLIHPPCSTSHINMALVLSPLPPSGSFSISFLFTALLLSPSLIGSVPVCSHCGGVRMLCFPFLSCLQMPLPVSNAAHITHATSNS